jgi:hypothetical protein
MSKESEYYTSQRYNVTYYTHTLYYACYQSSVISHQSSDHQMMPSRHRNSFLVRRKALINVTCPFLLALGIRPQASRTHHAGNHGKQEGNKAGFSGGLNFTPNHGECPAKQRTNNSTIPPIGTLSYQKAFVGLCPVFGKNTVTFS